MIPNSAIIKTDRTPYDFRKRVCGLYPLERNILILARSGIEKIYLDLSTDELAFYHMHVASHIIRNTYGAQVVELGNKKIADAHLSIPSNIFLQLHYFSDGTRHFKKIKTVISPVMSHDIFLIQTDQDYARAEARAVQQILDTTGGYIARNLNKRISIPISRVLSKTRIHPNYLTVLNMLVGVGSALCIIQDQYWYGVLGGFLFQCASVFDGVDGEVAKFTFKFSKLGGWLDTISDNTTLLLFLLAISFLFIRHTPGMMAIIIITILFLGIAGMLFAMVRYLSRFTESGSLVTYEKEFLQKLPDTDRLAWAMNTAKYITKKEFFALAFFLITFTGYIEMSIPLIAFITMVAGISLPVLNRRYLPGMAIKKKK